MINPDFQKYLEKIEPDWAEAPYLLLYEALEWGTNPPPTTEEFTTCYKQAVEKMAELNLPITEEGLLQTINGWMFVLLSEYPNLIIEYGRILGLSNDHWQKAIEEIRDDMKEPEYFLGDKAVQNIGWIEEKLFLDP